MSTRSATRLRAYQSLCLVRDLQNKRAEIAAQQEAAEARRLQSEAEDAESSAREAEAMWRSNLAANKDPSLQQYWALHALALDRDANDLNLEAQKATKKADAARSLWSVALARLEVAHTLHGDANDILQVELDEARLAAQEDRDMERRRRV